jgi:solute carrier family 12 (sodium/potassium/chloride transporter), member 2
MSLYGGMIYAGCFAATLSTALTNLLSVPRLVQALGVDKIYPGVIFFSKGYGKSNGPYRGYALTFMVSLIFLLIADLNAVAPLISNFYLAAYALINLCTFHAAFVKPLGWRPSFKFYNAWLSLFGFVLCVAIMFMLSWISSLITFTIIFLLYLLVSYRKPDVNWGSSTQEQTYKTALAATHRMQRVNDHIKNYHPQVLVLSGNPATRPPLIDLGNLITKNHSLLVVGDVVRQKLSYRARNELINEAQKWLEARKVKAFYNVVDNIEFESGVRALIQSSGLGKLSPNIVLMGYKNDWRCCSSQEILTYFNTIHNAFESRVAVAILSLPNGTDFSEYFPEYNKISAPVSHVQSRVNFQLGQSQDDLTIKPKQLIHNDSNLNLEGMNSSYNNTISNQFSKTF